MIFDGGAAVPVFVPHSVVEAEADFDSDGLGEWKVSMGQSPDVAATFRCRQTDVGFTPTTVWATEYKLSEADGTKYVELHQLAALVMFYAWYDAFPATQILQADGTLVKP